MNKETGLGLPELLISLFLAGLISTLLIQAYVLNKQQYLTLHEQLEVNFDVQWVNDLLADSIRRDGFTPCLSVEQLEVVDRRLIIPELDPSRLSVHRMSEQFGELIRTSGPKIIEVSKEAVLSDKQSLLIADCEHAEIHQVVHIEKTSISSVVTLAKPLSFSYPSITYVGRWVDEQWFIKPNGQGVNALYYKSEQSEELSALIHTLVFEKKWIQGKQIVDLTLGLDQEKTHHLRVVVRS